MYNRPCMRLTQRPVASQLINQLGDVPVLNASSYCHSISLPIRQPHLRRRRPKQFPWHRSQSRHCQSHHYPFKVVGIKRLLQNWPLPQLAPRPSGCYTVTNIVNSKTSSSSPSSVVFLGSNSRLPTLFCHAVLPYPSVTTAAVLSSCFVAPFCRVVLLRSIAPFYSIILSLTQNGGSTRY
jgi:hypothetical protein